MRQVYISFVRGISSNGLSKTGVILTTASFLSFCFLEVLRIVSLLTNAYIGHHRDMGCFRCHNSDMADEEGNRISDDCTLCHSILAHEETELFKYLFQIEDTLKPDRAHQYLQREFLESFE